MNPDSQTKADTQAIVNGVSIDIPISTNGNTASLPYSTLIKSFMPWGLPFNFLGKAVYGKRAEITYDGAKLGFSSAGIKGAVVAGLTRKVVISTDYTKWKFYAVTYTGHATLELDSVSGQRLYGLMQVGPYASKLLIQT